MMLDHVLTRMLMCTFTTLAGAIDALLAGQEISKDERQLIVDFTTSIRQSMIPLQSPFNIAAQQQTAVDPFEMMFGNAPEEGAAPPDVAATLVANDKEVVEE